FDLGEVQLPVGMGVFVEARLPGGFTHRYAVSSKSVQKPLSLFHFSEGRIGRWLQGLEGGLSAESGLVVGSVPASKAKMGSPKIKSLGVSAKGSAETYWLDSQDQLMDPTVSAPSSARYVQWLGVEVSGRSVLAGLQSSRGRWLEAKWLPVSPGVITVVSPEE
ncbi:MAG: hypothetical protein KGQ59_08565, partial [Bdellovibrionales bacterium]|nr:hypothetical protein [Bdellovibrionales bacterium]